MNSTDWRIDVLRGCAALLEALDGMGRMEGGDKEFARVIVEHETEVRRLVDYALHGMVGAKL